MSLDLPVVANNFRIKFYKEDAEADTFSVLRGDRNHLSINVTRFSFDSISQEFTMSFRIPLYYAADFMQDIKEIGLFKHFLIDGRDNPIFERTFNIDRITNQIEEYAYDSDKAIEVVIRGIYK